MEGSLQTLPAQPIEVCLLELDPLKADWLQHILLFNFFSSLPNLVIWKELLNLFSKITSWQCFHNKRNKCSHSPPSPCHFSKSVAVDGSEYCGSFKLLFTTNLRVHFRWLMGTFPSLSIRTRALLTQLWNLNFLHLKSCSGLGLGISVQCQISTPPDKIKSCWQFRHSCLASRLYFKAPVLTSLDLKTSQNDRMCTSVPQERWSWAHQDYISLLSLFFSSSIYYLF